MVFDGQFTTSCQRKGFTLIELLISVALLLLLLSLGPFVNVSTLRDYQISQEADYLVSNLRHLQLLALFHSNDSHFGIQFTQNSYSLFIQTSPEEKEVFRSRLLPKGFILSAPPQILFYKNTGKPSWSGIIAILEQNPKNKFIFHKKEIHINAQGNIEILQ